MINELSQIFDDVVGAARADPSRAPHIYLTAAEQFRAFARQRRFAASRAALAALANELEAAAVAEHPLSGSDRVSTCDFDEIEERYARARAEVQGDDLEVSARQRELQKLGQVSNHVSISPESVTESTALGRVATVKWNPTEAEKANEVYGAATVVLWQGTKFESQAFTIDVGVTNFPELGSSIACRPYAIITCGADGFQNSYKCDVGLGVRLTGVGNYCSVLVGMDPPRDPSLNGQMTIGASLGFFGAPSQAPVFLTSYLSPIAPAAVSDPVLRPKRAQFILPPQMDEVLGSVEMRFLDASSAVRYVLPFACGSVVAPIPLTSEIAAVTITNTSLVPLVLSIPWQLST